MDIELRHLRSFLAVAEERHFGRAAERLHVAQPSLSQQIRRLERELGTELLDRNSRPIELTPAGDVFLSEARLAVEQTQRAVENGRRAGRGELGHLSIGTTFWAYAALLPAVLRAFRDCAPHVRMQVTTAHPTLQVDALHSKWLDVCFLAFAQWLTGRRAIEVEPLLEEPMVAIVADNHALARREEVALTDLAEHPLLALAHGMVPGLIDRQMATFHQHGLYPTQIQEAPDPLALFSLIAAGVGVGIHMASFSNMNYPGVTFIPIAGDPLTATLLMLWRRDDDRQIIHHLRDTARQAAQTLAVTDSSKRRGPIQTETPLHCHAR